MVCPDDDTLAALVAGDAAPSPELQAHVDRCRTCRDVLAAAIRGESADEPSDGLDRRYRLVEEITRGPHARVSIAHDPHIGRDVALKELVADHDDPARLARAEARFLREARITAQLGHPAIAPVHEIGRDADGTPYYTMTRIRGETLADALARWHSLADRLRLLGHFTDVCHAIAYP